MRLQQASPELIVRRTSLLSTARGRREMLLILAVLCCALAAAVAIGRSLGDLTVAADALFCLAAFTIFIGVHAVLVWLRPAGLTLFKEGFEIWDRIGWRFLCWSDIERFELADDGRGVLVHLTPELQDRIRRSSSFRDRLRRFWIADRACKRYLPRDLEICPQELLLIMNSKLDSGRRVG